MNIFENYLIQIHNIIEDNKDILKVKKIESLNNINLEVPPEYFNYDFSTNVSLILSKKNGIHPKELANSIKDILLN